MPRTCTICSHPKRKAIEKALVLGTALRNIAKQYGVGHVSIQRHLEHVQGVIRKAKDSGDVKRAVSLTDQLEEMRQTTEKVLSMAVGMLTPLNGELVLKAIDRRHKQIELAARLAGEFKQDAPNLTDEQRAQKAAEILERGKLRLVSNA